MASQSRDQSCVFAGDIWRSSAAVLRSPAAGCRWSYIFVWISRATFLVFWVLYRSGVVAVSDGLAFACILVVCCPIILRLLVISLALMSSAPELALR